MEDCSYPNDQDEMIHWGLHLGEDCNMPAETHVYAIGDGKVVHKSINLGSLQKRHWGGLVIIEHDINSKKFHSLCGHLQNIMVDVGDEVVLGDMIGEIAPASSPENGWWEDCHLHFGIYVGPYKNNQMLVGYYREDQGYTKPEYWKAPTEFIGKFMHKYKVNI